MLISHLPKTLGAILLATIALQANLEAAESEAKLIAVLTSDAPDSQKAITCKKLAVYGTEASVPHLKKLLEDGRFCSWARIALEAIPGESVDQALRDSLDIVQGRNLVGVINSIGVRRDPAAVDALSKRLSDKDEQIASAAAVALGHIGDQNAIGHLIKNLADTPENVRTAVAEGCILSAERLLDSGNKERAARLYERVRVADVSKQRHFEATRGAILAREDGTDLLVEQLRGQDKEYFGLGLRVSREMKGESVTTAMAHELQNVKPDRQANLIRALADRTDAAVLPAILEVAMSGKGSARRVAVQSLGRVGDISCLPTLLAAANDSDSQLAAIAVDAVQALPGDNVNSEISTQLAKSSGQSRIALLQLVGLRRIHAVEEVAKSIDDSDARTRAAALTALGATVDLKDLGLIISRLTSRKHAEDKAVAKKALLTASVRMADPNACASQLGDALKKTDVTTQCDLLEILGTMGGTKALELVGNAAASQNDKLKDTASQLLGKWMTADAAPVLLGLAKPKANDKYRIRALRGYLRIARQFKLRDNVRAEMCRNALKTAGRSAEKELTLQILERYPSLQTLQVAVEAAKDPTLKKEATRVAMAIAQKVGGDSEEAKKLLKQIGQKSVKVEILKAEYGTSDKLQDVTSVVRKGVGNLPIVSLPSQSYNSSFGGDPAPGIPKQLIVQYKINGTSGKASFNENSLVILPLP